VTTLVLWARANDFDLPFRTPYTILYYTIIVFIIFGDSSTIRPFHFYPRAVVKEDGLAIA